MAESIVWAVDNLTELLNAADIGAILRDFGRRTLRQDPVVHFYETFLAAYDPRMRELRGVYYTPEPVVSYIVRSIDHILKSDFGLEKGLADAGKIKRNAAILTASQQDAGGTKGNAAILAASQQDAGGTKGNAAILAASQQDAGGTNTEVHKVQILDPATGTGTFLHGVVDHIYETFKGNEGMWPSYVATELLPRLYGFELLMAPYAVAHMKLGIQLAETGYDFKSGERLNVYLTNTLEEAVVLQNPGAFDRFLNEERDAANRVKKDAPVMVVLGNPPYSGHSANIGQWMTQLLRGIDSTAKVSKTHSYFHVDGKELGERNPKWLNDDYVKFIRFAQWRIEQTGYGVLGFITNHGYLDNPTFRGMRQSLMDTFDDIYILDLHGNSKRKETAPDGGEDKNVFDIQQGVAIGIFVKKKGKKTVPATVRHADLWGAREKKDSAGRIIAGKYAWLAAKDVSSTKWKKLKPNTPFYLFIPQDERLRKEYEAGWSIKEIMPVNSVGIVTARDDLAIGFTKEEIWKRVRDFAQLPVEEARGKYDLGNDAQDWKVSLAQDDLKKSGLKKELLKPVLYRPFDTRHTYYTGASRGFHCRTREDVMRHMLAGDNLGLISARSNKSSIADHFFCTNNIMETKCGERTTQSALFPLYLYPDKKTNGDIFTNGLAKHVNLAPQFIADFEQKLSMKFICTAAILAACQQDAGGTKGNADVAIRNRGRLPHWEMEGGVYFVTFRLADSLPQRVLKLYQAEREEILERAKRPGRELTPLEQQKLADMFSEKIDGFLDSGAGERYMENPQIARLVAEALMRFDGERYHLYAYCVMPNHVHVVFRPFSNYPLEKTLHSWKSYTSNEANKILGRDGAFWQREYYDHVIRDEEEFNRIIEYVLLNPVKANLHDWQWVYVRSNAAILAACQQDAGGTHKDRQDGGAFTPEDVFHYIYAIFHSPTYRDRYAPFLKGDFPRVPLTANVELFKKLAKLGERLTALHLMEADGSALPSFPVEGDNVVEKARYTRPGEGADEGRVFINKTQYFAPVTPEVWNFHVGGYQVAEKWLKDRKGRQLSFTELEHYRKTIAALSETIDLMTSIDAAIEGYGGWPVG
jgi:REP element-mobilizing transposase RayT